MVTCSSSGIY